MSNDTLDALEWDNVLTLSTSKIAKRARQNLFNKNESNDYIDLTSIIKKEKSYQKKIHNINNGITLASIMTGGISCIESSIALFSIAGLCISLADLFIKKEIDRRLRSFSILGESINSIAVKNKTADRLKII